MPYIRRRTVSHLNDEVMNSLKKVKDKTNMSVDEAKALKSAILKDGKVDANEKKLLKELIVAHDPVDLLMSPRKTTPSSLSPNIKGATPQNADTIRMVGAKDPSLKSSIELKQLSKDSADALHITCDDKADRQAQMTVDFIGDAVSKMYEKRSENHTYQYKQGTKVERKANCGPASAATVGKNMGVKMPKLSQIRTDVNAPKGTEEGIYGLTTQQVIDAVKVSAKKQGITIQSHQDVLSTNVDEAVNKIRNALAQDKQVILLTSNLAITKASSLKGETGTGHYVVVRSVKNDGSIVISDPQKKDGEGNRIVHSKAHLETHLKRRVRLGRDNVLLSFQHPEQRGMGTTISNNKQLSAFLQGQEPKETDPITEGLQMAYKLLEWKEKGLSQEEMDPELRDYLDKDLKQFHNPKPIVDPNALKGTYQINHEAHAPKSSHPR